MKKLLTASLSLVLVFLMLVLSGCNSSPEQTNSEETTVLPSEKAVSVSVENTENEITTENVQEPQSEIGETETLSAETTLPSVPSTTEGIVALFNESANKIKKDASKVVKNYEKRIVDRESLEVPKSLKSAAEGLLTTFMKDDTEPIVYATKEEIAENFLVPEQSYVSKLKAQDVEKATCTDNGKEYEIYIKLKPEKNPTSGSGVGSVCDVIETHEVSEKVSFVENFTTEYYDCEVRATVDKETGRVIHINYSTPLIFDVTVNMFGTHKGIAGLTFIKDYTITY